MSREKKTQEWMSDFQEFLKADESAPPSSLSERIVAHVRNDFNPSFQKVAAKLVGIHAMAAGIVTLFCPQLGVGPVIGGHGIMHLFMRFGPLGCAAVCGAFFLGTSTLLVSLLLKRTELRLAYRHAYLNVAFLAALTFVGLMLAGGQSDRMSELFWLAGAIVGGSIVLQLGLRLRLGSFRNLHLAR